MILLAETTAQFGYQVSALTPGSHRHVVWSCDGCGSQQSTEYRVARVGTGRCLSCVGKAREEAAAARGPKWKVPAHVDGAETQCRFGYRPDDLNPQSNKRVVAACRTCGIERVVSPNNYGAGQCKPCAAQANGLLGAAACVAKVDEWKAAGLGGRGRPLVPTEVKKAKREIYHRKWVARNRAKLNEQARAFQARVRATPEGRLVSLLRSNLRKAITRRGVFRKSGCFKHLTYTPTEFVAHIHGRLAACGHVCNGCGADLRNGYDIDHVMPLATAKTVEEVVALFALENLDVLCHRCNVKKSDRLPVAA